MDDHVIMNLRPTIGWAVHRRGHAELIVQTSRA